MTSQIELGKVRFSVPERVFFDATFIIALRNDSDKWHDTAQALLVELLGLQAQARVRLFTSARVMDEVWWKLAMLLCEAQEGEGAWNISGQGGRLRALFTYGPQLKAAGEDLQQMNVEFLGVPRDSIDPALALVTRPSPNMAPADAFHVAVMKHHNIRAIATNDHDFDVVAKLTRLFFNFPI